MIRFLLAAALTLGSAAALAQFNGCPPGFCNPSTAAVPASDNGLLLEDGVNYLLLEDGTSTLCMEGGC